MSDNDDRRGKGAGGGFRGKGPRREHGGRSGGPGGERSGGGERKFSGKPRFDRDRKEGGREGGSERRFGGKPSFNRDRDGERSGGGGERKFAGKPRFDRDRKEGGREGGERRFGGKPSFNRDRGGEREGGGERRFGGKPFNRDRDGERSGGGGERKFSGKPRFDRDRKEGEREGGGERRFTGKPRFNRDRDGERSGGGGERKFSGKPRFDRDRKDGGREGGGERRFTGKPSFSRDRDGERGGGGERKFSGKPRFDRDRNEGGREGGGERRFTGKPRFDRDRRDGDRDGGRKFRDKPRFDKDRADKDTRRPERDRTAPRDNERDDQLVRVSGLPSVTELFRSSPDRVERLFFSKDMHPDVNAFCSKLAERRKVYREVEPDELRRVAGTAMHGGVVALAEPKPIHDLDEAAAQEWAAAGEMLVVLDGVGNPQNIGAIARTASFLGIKRILISDHPAQAGLSNAAYRIAKGGLEGVDVYRVPELPATLRRLKTHFHVVGTALEQGGPLDALPLAPKPVALVLGNEENGLDEATLAACHSVVSIPGGGTVQSLNVSAAAAILIHTLLRRAKRT